MCTYITDHVKVEGSGKGGGTWRRLEDASIYFDHPSHIALEHSLNIDFFEESADPSTRIGLELSASSARELANTILAVLDKAPPGLI